MSGPARCMAKTWSSFVPGQVQCTRPSGHGGLCVWPEDGEGATMPAVAPDPIARPSHYIAGPYECREVIAELGLNFNLGAAFKYLWRAGRKGPALDDLRKAANCIGHEIARLERKP